MSANCGRKFAPLHPVGIRSSSQNSPNRTGAVRRNRPGSAHVAVDLQESAGVAQEEIRPTVAVEIAQRWECGIIVDNQRLALDLNRPALPE